MLAGRRAEDREKSSRFTNRRTEQTSPTVGRIRTARQIDNLIDNNNNILSPDTTVVAMRYKEQDWRDMMGRSGMLLLFNVTLITNIGYNLTQQLLNEETKHRYNNYFFF